MNILGLHGNFGRADHDAAACIVMDDKVAFAQEEERFLRNKHATGVMPEYAIRAGLKHCGLSIRDIERVCIPRMTWRDFEKKLPAFFWYNFGYCPRITYYDHHLCHAASAFHLSGFDDALVISIDGSGDGVSTAVYKADASGFHVLEEIHYPNSLGLFAAFMTQYLGFRSQHGEYKMMGWAPYGKPCINLDFVMHVDASQYHFRHEYLHEERMRKWPESHHEQLPYFNDAFATRLGIPPRLKTDPIDATGIYADLAASVQAKIEDAVLMLAKKWDGHSRNLCITGGVGNNSTLNGKLALSNQFANVYVPPSPGDAGTALGAAVLHASINGVKFSKLDTALLGPEWSNDEIKAILERNNLGSKEVNPAECVARLLADGLTVAWFQGRSEFGPRALGGRSLLANPTVASTHVRMNKIKKREEFRPFAPSIAENHVADYFDRYKHSEFMSYTFPANENGRKMLSACIHVDGTARLQSVKEGSVYADMIQEFGHRTGVYAVLNTSLNADWEPIILTPENALAFFMATGVDRLVLGNQLIAKRS